MLGSYCALESWLEENIWVKIVTFQKTNLLQTFRDDSFFRKVMTKNAQNHPGEYKYYLHSA